MGEFEEEAAGARKNTGGGGEKSGKTQVGKRKQPWVGRGRGRLGKAGTKWYRRRKREEQEERANLWRRNKTLPSPPIR